MCRPCPRHPVTRQPGAGSAGSDAQCPGDRDRTRQGDPSGRPVGRPLTGPPVAVSELMAFSEPLPVRSPPPVGPKVGLSSLVAQRHGGVESGRRKTIGSSAASVDLGDGLRARGNVTLQRHPATSPSQVVALLRSGGDLASTCREFVSNPGGHTGTLAHLRFAALLIYRGPSLVFRRTPATCLPAARAFERSR